MGKSLRKLIHQRVIFHIKTLLSGVGMQEIEHGIFRNSADDGWYVILVKSVLSQNIFFGVSYGDSRRSYVEVQKYNAVLRPYKEGFLNHQIPLRSKKHSDLPVGITLFTRISCNKGEKGTQITYNFKVSRIQARPTTVYMAQI